MKNDYSTELKKLYLETVEKKEEQYFEVVDTKYPQNKINWKNF